MMKTATCFPESEPGPRRERQPRPRLRDLLLADGRPEGGRLRSLRRARLARVRGQARLPFPRRRHRDTPAVLRRRSRGDGVSALRRPRELPIRPHRGRADRQGARGAGGATVVIAQEQAVAQRLRQRRRLRGASKSLRSSTGVSDGRRASRGDAGTLGRSNLAPLPYVLPGIRVHGGSRFKMHVAEY